MTKASKDVQPPDHHLKHRSADKIEENPDEVTAATAKRSRIKRALPEETGDGPFRLKHFRDRVKRAHATEQANPLRKRRAAPVKATVPIHLESDDAVAYSVVDTKRETDDLESRDEPSPISKRWWGTFANWLKKATTVQDNSKGDLPLDFAQNINLFRQSCGCLGKGYRDNLRMDLDAEFSMQAAYAYYYSGNFAPPSKPDVFFYFGIEPEAYLGLILEGNVRLNATSRRRKIIDTLSYPGLAIKGIAAVGPTLNVYGQVQGFINIQGKARAGAKVSFGRAEEYWLEDEALLEDYDNILGLDLKHDHDIPELGQVTPVFESGVAVETGLDIIVQPEMSVSNPDRRITIFYDEGTIDLAGVNSRHDLPTPDNASTPVVDNTFTRKQADVNCHAFRGIELTDNDGGTLFVSKGLCYGYKAGDADGRELTHAPGIEVKAIAAEKARRDSQCTSDYCDDEKDELQEALGVTANHVPKLQCDEFPWAASEEGGDYEPSSRRSQTCVPGPLNRIGCSCVRMMSDVWSNVEKMEPSEGDPDTREDVWVRWKETYGEDEDNVYTYNSNNILCAVNTFGQDEWYRQPRRTSNSAQYNGICFTRKHKSEGGWPDVYSTGNCLFTFGPSASSPGDNKKRNAGWDFKHIEYLTGDDADKQHWDAKDLLGPSGKPVYPLDLPVENRADRSPYL
ncbi:Killer toxin subunits alpha/beta 1 [Emericellopsis cladophorae]|uniref:Killer toxin subunits alpha/beta 1 n=1 Tax=Emericellopsis cladophorae TaxID=2686198 RepID=A0A9P9XXW4_9HYPO|nr:Killer toxin subunits alpha/beta 1 [Emericellopsis cladophorae]KAI6779877.1 Killer toxin subunits alpha/beta 1 [Emericellopsis cladophorae]